VFRFLKGVDAFRGAPAGLDAVADKVEKLDLRDQLPRDPKRALEIVDRILAFARRRTKVEGGKVVASPLKVAVILDYAHFIAPQGDPIYVADLSQTLIQIQEWAANPEVTSAFVATVLVTENLADLNRSLAETPYSAKIRIPLPSADDIREFVLDLVPDVKEFEKASEVTREVLADKLVGLSRVSVRTLVKRALTSGERITGALPHAHEEGADREGGRRPSRVPGVVPHARRRGRPRRGEGLDARGRAAAEARPHDGDPDGLPADRGGSAPARRTWWSAWPARSASPASR
jgi:hypothetical protein